MSEKATVYRFEYYADKSCRVKCKAIPCTISSRYIRANNANENLLDLKSNILKSKLDKVSMRGNVLSMVSLDNNMIDFIDKCYDTLKAKLDELAYEHLRVERMIENLKGEMNG